jgi:hypothetical protein
MLQVGATGIEEEEEEEEDKPTYWTLDIAGIRGKLRHTCNK